MMFFCSFNKKASKFVSGPVSIYFPFFLPTLREVVLHTIFLSLDAPNKKTTMRIPQFCPQTESLGVIWKQVEVGQELERPCPDDKLGMMSWKCTRTGWRGRRPDTSNCVSPWLDKIDSEVSQKTIIYVVIDHEIDLS